MTDTNDTPKTVMVTIQPRLASEANVTIALNGHSQVIPCGVPTPVREDMLEVIKNSDLSYTIDRHESAASDGEADGGGAVAGAGSPAATPGQDQGPAARSGPDDDHAKTGQVDKEFAVGGYQPAGGAAGADEALEAAAEGGVPKGDLEADADADDDKSFDADAVITGNVADVTGRLAALTPAQRKKVLAAEKDREVPRKGVLDALAHHD